MVPGHRRADMRELRPAEVHQAAEEYDIRGSLSFRLDGGLGRVSIIDLVSQILVVSIVG